VPFFETFRAALRSLASNRLRTLLTALGTVIGVASVIIVLAVGEGATASVEGNIRALGTNLLSVRPPFGSSGLARTGAVVPLSMGDAEAIGRLPGVASVSPEANGSALIAHLTQNTTATVVGVVPSYLDVRALSIGVGIGFTDLDLMQRRRITLLGANVASALFGTESAVGQTVQIAGHAFVVVGVLEAKGDAGYLSPDDQVLVPLTTHQGVLFGGDDLSGIGVSMADEEHAAEVQASVEALLRLRHDIRDDEPDDFSVRSQTEMLQTMGAITGTLTLLLGAVALISLLVGGIGIMNIMLASVRERTREIGVRMAVGARRRDILLQFLAESVVVSLGGGLLGIVVGFAGAALIARIAGWETIVPMYGIVVSLGVAGTVGVIFGVGPARAAANLDPVAALRQE